MVQPILEMQGIQKYFPGVHALDDCRFELRAGEVHALVGENGAGKSTLMKILSGIYPRDGGSVRLDGREINVKSTLEAQRLGISIIHQEINLMQDLTVSENIYIGREPTQGILLNGAKQDAQTNALLDSLRLTDIRAGTRVRTLTVAKQQMVEIAKALSFSNTRILIMDSKAEGAGRRHRLHIASHGGIAHHRRSRYRYARRQIRRHAQYGGRVHGRYHQHDGRPRDL